MKRKITKALQFPKLLFFGVKALSDFYEDFQSISRRESYKLDNLISLVINERYRVAKNEFNKFGGSFFSQGDEDGLTLEIIKRLNPTNKHFLEIGVGDGRENNTLILRSKGYKGAWVDSLENNHLKSMKNSSFYYSQQFVDRNSVVEILNDYREFFRGEPAVISIDIDGNDYWIWKSLLEHGYRPELAIAEYNARFPVPIEWVMEYNPEHKWQEDDYYGASLSALAALFSKFDYFPVVCSIHGTNVFFVKKEFENKFPERTDLHNIFVEPLYNFKSVKGHKVAIKTLLSILSGIRNET